MTDNRIDRTRLPIADPNFAGVVNRTLQGSRAGLGPDRARRRRPRERRTCCWYYSTMRASVSRVRSAARSPTPDHDPGRRGGSPLQPLPRDGAVLADAGGAADRPQSPRGRLRLDRRVPGGFPGYTAFVPQDSAPFPKVLRENGYSTAAFGKWHLTPDGQQGAAGPFDRWPNGWGFDYFWGFLGGETGQWDPVITENNKIIGAPARARTRKTVLLPRRHGRQDDRVAARGPRPGPGQAVVRLLTPPGAATRRTTSRRSGPPSTRGSSTAAGTSLPGARRSRGRSSSV